MVDQMNNEIAEVKISGFKIATLGSYKEGGDSTIGTPGFIAPEIF